jgi:hypothetical protein
MAAFQNDQKPPKREIGSPPNVGFGFIPGVPGWSALATQVHDHVPELRGQAAIHTYDRMLTNPQVWALFMGMMLPITEYDIGLEPGDADEGMTAVLAADLGLPVGLPAPGEKGPPLGPGLYRFNFLEHLWQALFAAVYGHYYFEQVGTVEDDGLWHLTALAPRAPHDILDIIVDDSGDLEAIIHPGPRNNGAARFVMEVPIPASQLIGYVWLPDARRRWVGRSMLRACYEPWLLRDILVRVDTTNHDRAGGVPVVETDETWQGADLSEGQQVASAFRVGQESGAALPPGMHLKLARVGGTDVIGSVRYHDEAMARAWGAMVRQLGQTMTGSRALGMTFADLEGVVRRSVMRWFAGTFREHMIEDWWRWNVPPGPDGKLTPHPSLAWRDSQDPSAGNPVPNDPNAIPGPAPNPQLAPSPRVRGGAARQTRLVNGGDVGPARKGGSTAETSAQVAGSNPAIAAALRLPARPLRRQPYTLEVQAAVDFAALDIAYDAGVEDAHALFDSAWLRDLTQQAEDAVTFTKAGTVRQRLTRLDAARMTLKSPDPAPLVDILAAAARVGSDTATSELAGQGVAVFPLSDDEISRLVTDQAAAAAEQITDGIQLAASRRAVQMNAGRTPGEVATAVSDYLGGLAHRWEHDQLMGAVQAATNAARMAIFARIPAEEPAGYYASELLDTSTCGPCAGNDGREYPTLEAAQRDYSFGGFNACLGGSRCRGTIVALMTETAIAPGTPAHLGAG